MTTVPKFRTTIAAAQKRQKNVKTTSFVLWAKALLKIEGSTFSKLQQILKDELHLLPLIPFM
jgi:hypothetical protein